MPCTPWRRTSSATRNASTIVTPRSSTDSSRLLGTTISVSTSAPSAAIPASAWSRRREPSNWNGRVTIPTVSAPSSRAIWATTGAAPVPVPPPAPAAMNTMSAPRSIALIWSCCLVGGAAAKLGIGARPEPARDAVPDVERLVRGRLLKRLQVGVDRQELDPFDLGLDHPVDGVDAATADANDPQDGPERRCAGLQIGGRVGARVDVDGLLGRTARRPRPGRCVEHVLGDVGRERLAQALLWRGDVARLLGLGLTARRDVERRVLRCDGGRSGVCATGSRRRRAARLPRLRRAGRSRRRSFETDLRAAPLACSRAYRLPFARTSLASCL